MLVLAFAFESLDRARGHDVCTLFFWSLSFPDQTFDGFVMNFGILHLAQPQQVIAEAYRVLKPTGMYGFTVWAGPEHSPTPKWWRRVSCNMQIPLLKCPKPWSLSVQWWPTLQTNAYWNWPPQKINSISIAHYWMACFLCWILLWTEMRAGVRTVAYIKRQTPKTISRIRASVNEMMQQFF